MHSDPSFNSLVIGILTSIPAILLALAALWRVVKGEARMEGIERAANGEKERLVRKLVEDAWQEGRLAGIREHSALLTPPPPLAPKLDHPGGSRAGE